MSPRSLRPTLVLGVALASVVLEGCALPPRTAHSPQPTSSRPPARPVYPNRASAVGPDGLPQLPPPDAPKEEGTDEDPLAETSPPDPLGQYAPQEGAIATRYAALDRTTCERELNRRNIAFKPLGETRGVVAPLRLEGPLSGVTYRSMLPAKQRETSVYEIYDCRLVLALDDFAKILARHDIVEVVHYSVYRPPPPKFAGQGRRHPGGLAIDAAIFKTRDGRSMSVEKDFHGRIGAKPCPAAEGATELHHLACEAADARLFNVVLTPDYNWPHRNHFHMEVTPGVRWTFVR